MPRAVIDGILASSRGLAHGRFACAMLCSLFLSLPARAEPADFFRAHCYECHDSTTKEAGLDLSKLKMELSDAANFARWVKIFDRVESGEMPPKSQKPPPAADRAKAVSTLRKSLLEAEQAKFQGQGRTGVRRLTRGEYENTIRDLFDLAGIALQGGLPADGSAHGFDKNSDALDISHVNLAKYVEAADHALDLAIATQPRPPVVHKQRIALCNPGAGVAHVLMYGDAVMLKDKQPDKEFPPAGEQPHIDQGAHEAMGSYRYRPGTAVGLFRHEDESFSPYFLEFATLYPGRYRVRASFWSFQWDKGKVLPARGTEAARLSAVQLTNDGRHTGDPSYVLGYFDAPSLKSQEHEFITWLNYKETLGFNAASLAPGANTRGKGHALGFTGPGIACDWLDVEGPLHDVWPPKGHRLLFGDLPLVEFKADKQPGVRGPKRKPLRQEIVHVLNRPDLESGVWTAERETASGRRPAAGRVLTPGVPPSSRAGSAAAVCRQG